jgi:flagellar hook-length control protein FliK
LQLTTAQSSSPQPTAQPVQAQVLPSGLNEVPAGQPVQPGTIQLTQAPEAAEARLAAPQTSLLLDVPVKDAAWGDQLGQRIQLMASHKLQSAEIRLTPAELGPLRVQVSVDDGVTNVTFHAQHAVTREAIEQALPRLRELLAESGLTLDQTHIGDPGLQREGRDGGHDASAAEFGGPDGLGNQDEAEMAAVPARTVTPDGLVDTFV